jgi:hypothetical protein
MMIFTLAAALLLSGPATSERKLRRPPYISAEVAEALKQKMSQHGAAMMWLSLSVVLLEHEEVEQAASQIVKATKIPRPTTSDPMRALPPRFFELQDDLTTKAQALVDAAKKKNDTEMAAAHARMTSTCIACHSAYLNPTR